jgi:hypothetical protein
MEESMPGNFSPAQLIPPFPLHWTTILHYIVILAAIAMLMTSGDKAPMSFLFVLAALALLAGIDLYSPLLNVSRIFVFLIRFGIFGIPVVLAGLAPTEQARSLGVVTAIIAFPILVVTFITCLLGPLGDPRIAIWC